MFVYQDNKLFVETEGKLVGVNFSPTGTTLVNETTPFVDGMFLTYGEVKCRFGESYTFPIKVGDTNDQCGETPDTESTPRGRRRTRK